LFTAAWHFFQNFIGAQGNFIDLINEIVDGIIATVLDIFGEVPILGQALQQFAVIISEVRDLLNVIANAVQAFFDAFDINLSDIGSIGDLFGPFKPIVNALIEALDGINLPDFTVMFHRFAQFLEPAIDFIAHLINIATGVVKLVTGQIDISDFQDILTDFTIAADPDGAPGGLSVHDFVMGIINFFLDPVGFFLGQNSPLNALNLFNVPWLNALIPLGHLGNVQERNLIDDPYFTVAIDSSAYVTDSEHHGSTGNSAKVIGDGTAKDLLSNRIPVDPGQEIRAYAWAKYASITGTGTPIKLGLTYYLNDAPVVQQDLVSLSSSPSTSDWRQLEDTHIAPDNVDSLSLRLTLGSTATGGTLKWSDIWLSKPAKKIPRNFIDQL